MQGRACASTSYYISSYILTSTIQYVSTQTMHMKLTDLAIGITYGYAYFWELSVRD
jgi:hypothetical protein